jgi:hypothetical protein
MMSLSKKKRITNRQLLDTYHGMFCLVCYRCPSDPCHIKSVGAGGDDTEDNLIPLCREHHIEQHKIGWVTFVKKYSTLLNILNEMGWVIEGHRLAKR